MDVIVGMADCDPSDRVVIAISRQPGLRHHLPGDVTPLCIAESPVLGSQPQRAVPDRLDRRPVPRLDWIVHHRGQRPHVTVAVDIGWFEVGQFTGAVPCRHESRTGVLFLAARTELYEGAPAEVALPNRVGALTVFSQVA
jgi:hypothetical protein